MPKKKVQEFLTPGGAIPIVAIRRYRRKLIWLALFSCSITQFYCVCAWVNYLASKFLSQRNYADESLLSVGREYEPAKAFSDNNKVPIPTEVISIGVSLGFSKRLLLLFFIPYSLSSLVLYSSISAAPPSEAGELLFFNLSRITRHIYTHFLNLILFLYLLSIVGETTKEHDG